MPTTTIITIGDAVPAEDIRSLFTTAVIVAGALHGTPSLLLTDEPRVDSKRRQVSIDCSNAAGECAARAFIGLMAHHHGGRSVRVTSSGGAS